MAGPVFKARRCHFYIAVAMADFGEHKMRGARSVGHVGHPLLALSVRANDERLVDMGLDPIGQCRGGVHNLCID